MVVSAFRQWVKSPILGEDEDTVRAATLLNTILVVFFIAALSYGLLVPVAPELRIVRVVIVIPFLLILLILKQVLNRGYVQLVGNLTVFALWLVFTSAMFFGTDYNNPAFMGYLLVVTCAGLVLSRRAALGWSFFVIVTTAVVLLLWQYNVFSYSHHRVAPIVFWMAQTIYVLTATFLLNQTLRKIDEALSKTRQSEERYRAVIENQNEFIVRWVPDGTRTFVNDAYCRYFGLTPEQAVSTSFFHLIFVDDRPAMDERLSRLVSGAIDTETYVHRVVKPDGSIGWQEWTDQAIRDETRQVLEIQSVGRDITMRKLSEQALRESEEEFRALVNYIPNAAIYLTSPNPDIGTYYVSPQIKELVGYSPEEWIANPKSWVEHIYPEDRERILAADARHEHTGEPFSQEYRLMTRDERMVWIHDQGAMVLDTAGGPRFSLGIMLDITERKQVEADLKQYAKRMELLHEIDRSLLSARSSHEIAKGALSRVRQLIPCLRAVVNIFDFETDQVFFLAADFDSQQTFLDKPVSLHEYGRNIIDWLQQDKPWIANDVLHDPHITELDKRLVDTNGIHAWLSLPLLSQGQLIGALNLGRGIGQSFTTQDAEYVREVANQIAIVVQQNRLLEETQRQIYEQKIAEEKLRRQAEQMSALYDIGLTIASNLDLNQILHDLFEKCRQLLPIDTFYIAVYDEDSQTIRHPLFYDGLQKAFIQVDDRSIETSPGLSGHIIRSKTTLYLPNSDDPAVREKYQHITFGIPSKSYVGVPMLIHDNAVGLISMQNMHADAYSPAQIRLLETIAIQAAIAIENARSYQAEQERRREAETLRESLTSVVALFELEEIVDRILDQIKLVIPYDTASVWRVDGKIQKLIGGRNLPPEVSNLDLEYNIDNPSNAALPIFKRELSYVLSNNVQEELVGFEKPPHNYINSWLSVPLKTKGKIIGLICLDGKRNGQFNVHHAELAVTFADQVAIALENASLYTEIQQELTERKRIETTLRQRDEILQAVAHAAQVFLQTSNWRESIKDVLQTLGKATDASHVYIFENHTQMPDGRKVTSQRYEWVSPNSKPEIDNPQYQNVALFGEGQQYWSEILSNGQTFVGRVSDLPPDEAEYFQSIGIKSILDVPIFVGGEWWGVIGFDDYLHERAWSPAEIEAFETAAKMISAAIESELTNASIRMNEERYRTIFENSPVSLLEEDFSDIRTYIDNLKNSGVKDFKEYFKTHPEEAKRCSKMVRIVDVNKTILEWYGVKDKTEFHKSLDQTMDPVEYESFIEELIALMQGEGRYELSISRQSHIESEGLIHLIISGIVVPGFEDSWERVLVSILDITKAKRSEEALRASEEKFRELNISLEKRVDERTNQLLIEKSRIEQVVNEVAILRRLSDFLQASMTVDEACNIVASHMQSLFANTDGVLYLISDGVSDLTMMTSWGEFKLESVIQPNDCWGMRRGRVFVRQFLDASPACSHFGAPPAKESMCLPLLAQNETIGLLCIQVSGNMENYFTSDVQNLAIASADSIALALANVRLRDRLRNQTIRDPLTGIFNRRFMEETLDREVHRAGRTQEPLCVIMFEIDDFKKYNNTFGHDAGDYVLKKVTDTMRSRLRKSDFPCRYGGDEFTLLLPNTTITDGAHRAEELRKAVEALALSFNNQALGQVTVRMGVAVYPKHGETGEAILKVADDASYRARAIGKNCVVVAD